MITETGYITIRSTCIVHLLHLNELKRHIWKAIKFDCKFNTLIF